MWRVARGERSSTRICASRGPQRLPSYARNSMPVAEPVTRSSASASGIPLATLDALLVEVQEPVVAVIGLLDRHVGGPVVESPELVTLVVRGRVQRLPAAELVDEPLDAPVVRTVRETVGDWDG